MEASPTRVLLVEDEISDALVVKRSLHREGAASERFDVEHAATLAEGIVHLGRARVDVLLVDLRLPDSDGPATVAQLRERDHQRAHGGLHGNGRSGRRGARIRGGRGRVPREGRSACGAPAPDDPPRDRATTGVLPPAPRRRSARDPRDDQRFLLHDLKNLHTSILGNARILQREVRDEGFLRQRADSLLGAARTAIDLIHKLCAGAEGAQEASRLLELSALVRGAEPLLRAVLPERVDLHFDLATDPARVAVLPGVDPPHSARARRQRRGGDRRRRGARGGADRAHAARGDGARRAGRDRRRSPRVPTPGSRFATTGADSMPRPGPACSSAASAPRAADAVAVSARCWRSSRAIARGCASAAVPRRAPRSGSSCLSGVSRWTPPSVLLIEDEPADAALVRRSLARTGGRRARARARDDPPGGDRAPRQGRRGRGAPRPEPAGQPGDRHRRADARARPGDADRGVHRGRRRGDRRRRARRRRPGLPREGRTRGLAAAALDSLCDRAEPDRARTTLASNVGSIGSRRGRAWGRSARESGSASTPLIGTIFDRCDDALVSLDKTGRAIRVRTALLEIHRAAFRAAEMVQRLRDYAAIERSASGQVDLASFVLEASELLAAIVSPEIDVVCDVGGRTDRRRRHATGAAPDPGQPRRERRPRRSAVAAGSISISTGSSRRTRSCSRRPTAGRIRGPEPTHSCASPIAVPRPGSGAARADLRSLLHHEVRRAGPRARGRGRRPAPAQSGGPHRRESAHRDRLHDPVSPDRVAQGTQARCVGGTRTTATHTVVLPAARD